MKGQSIEIKIKMKNLTINEDIVDLTKNLELKSEEERVFNWLFGFKIIAEMIDYNNVKVCIVNDKFKFHKTLLMNKRNQDKEIETKMRSDFLLNFKLKYLFEQKTEEISF